MDFTLNVSYDADAKRRFHSQGDAVLRRLAQELGYGKGDFDLRHNQGGIAVSGEITLHSDTLYVEISQTALGPEMGFMWRTVRNRKDYTGGQNQWSAWYTLNDLPALAARMSRAVNLVKAT